MGASSISSACWGRRSIGWVAPAGRSRLDWGRGGGFGPTRSSAGSATGAWARCSRRGTWRAARQSRSRCCRPPRRCVFTGFKREFRALADVVHPNLIRLRELVVPDAGPAFFTMELLDGQPFVRWVRGATPVGELPDIERLEAGVRRAHRPRARTSCVSRSCSAAPRPRMRTTTRRATPRSRTSRAGHCRGPTMPASDTGIVRACSLGSGTRTA